MGHIDREQSMQLIKGDLSAAISYGLELEVITEALLAMKENPNLSPEEAFAAGCQEWDVYTLEFDTFIDNLKDEENGQS
jgi:hypothetical protein